MQARRCRHYCVVPSMRLKHAAPLNFHPMLHLSRVQLLGVHTVRVLPRAGMRGDAASGPPHALLLLLLVVVAASAPLGATCAYAAQRLRGTASLLPAGRSFDPPTAKCVMASAGGVTAAADAESVESSLAAGAAVVLPAGERRSARKGGEAEMKQSEGSLLMGQQELLKFQAIGDWGRQGEFNESGVALAMAAHAAQNGLDFVITVGDNFYPREPPPSSFQAPKPHVKRTVCAPCLNVVCTNGR